MISELDNYFLGQEDPQKSYLQALRVLILKFHPGVSEGWKYSMPFYFYNKKRFCYLWIHKKYQQPYIGIVEGKKIHHKKLIAEKRSRMKIMLFDPEKDIPVKDIKIILRQAIELIQ